ncbi:MAG: hypothetical protein AUK44_08665 [Porphyromonadaceae bacterium CG2_30_38_12]|nr:MAG: hypothetical protein AUK44_08665 [Porphyromonadaceae bacterium CG2_30_38_12]
MKNLQLNKLVKLANLVVAMFAFATLISTFWKEKTIRDYEDIVKSGRIRVITDNSSLGFQTNKDSVFGFQYELIKLFVANMGVELEISENDDTQSAVDELIKGNCDVLASMIPLTNEYAQKILFSTPLQTNRQLLVQRKSDSTNFVHKLYELAGDTIHLTKNSAYKVTINHLSDEIADTIYTLELKNTSTDVAIKMVADSIIRFSICPERMATKMKSLYPNLDISIPIGFYQQNAWALNAKSITLQSKLNEFLDDFIGSSAYWELYRKYYKVID